MHKHRDFLNNAIGRPLNSFSYIFWDWNGTLLNDVSACIGAMNKLLVHRNMPEILPKRYRQIFGFPVKDYYTQLGFDFSKDSFEDLSVEFMDGYHAMSGKNSLVDHAAEVLDYFKQQGIKQVILSAMEQKNLLDQVQHYGMEKYFDEILGIEDIFANGKTHVGEKFIQEKGIGPGEVMYIGDTLHDYEVAMELNFHPLLYSNGHQTKERLEKTGAITIESLKELLYIG